MPRAAASTRSRTLTIRDSTISQNTVDATSSDMARLRRWDRGCVVTALQVFNSTIGQNRVSATGLDGAIASGGGIVVFGTTIEIVDTRSAQTPRPSWARSLGRPAVAGSGRWVARSRWSGARSTSNSARAANVSSGALVLGGGLYVNGTVRRERDPQHDQRQRGDGRNGERRGRRAEDSASLTGALTISGSTLAFNAAPQGANLSDAASARRGCATRSCRTRWAGA